MASSIKIKRSETSGNPTVLGAGELAYSALADNGSNGGDRLYIGSGNEIGGNAVNHVVIGGKYFTDQITAATNTNTVSTLVKRDASGNFSANTITASSFVGSLSGTVDTALSWKTARTLSLTGDATASLSVDGSQNVSAALTLATVNSNAATSGTVYGSSALIPVITVNSKGLVTAVTTAQISSTLGIAGGTGTGSVTLGTNTLTFTGGTGVTTAVSGYVVTLSIGQSVGITDNVTFNDLTVTGTLTSNDITSTNISIAGDATITGNLTVQGTTTTINSTAVAVSDVNLVLAKDATNATAANGAGLTVNGPTVPATLTYSSVDDRWNLNKALTVTTVYGNATTASAWETARTLSLSGDATASLSVDGSANVTATVTISKVDGGTY